MREVWTRKMAHDKERGRLDMNLADFYYWHLQQKCCTAVHLLASGCVFRYGLQSLIAEWSYNVFDGLERYR